MSHQPQPSPLAAAVRARQEALEHLASRNPARLSNAGFGYLQSLSADPAALATLFADAVFARAVSAGWRTALTGDTNPLLHTPDETAIIIASFLPTAKDLLHLAMACRRYSIKIVARPASTAAGFSAAAWSFAEEAARRWIDAAPAEQQAWAPRDGQQSWLQLMHEITVLRLPPQFSRSSRHFTELSSGPAWGPHSPRHIVEIARVWYGDDSDEEEDSETDRRGWGYRAALSDAIMRGGRHCAQFTFEFSNTNTMVGIVQAGSCPSAVLDAPRGCGPHLVDGNWFYCQGSGDTWPRRPDDPADGREDAR